MFRSRVIAITRNPALGKTLRTAMTAAGAEVRVVTSAAELGSGALAAELVVFHWEAEADGDGMGSLELAIMAELADRLPSGAHVIALLPRADLVTSVAAMRAHRRVAGALVADRVRAPELTAMATRLLQGDIFGLDKVLPWGARVHSLLVGDYPEKAEAVRQISTFAAAVGLRRIHRERIERCCDEMMMNALYDAPGAVPAGPDGAPLVDPAARVSGPSLAEEDRAVVEYGCDGQRFAVSVRDRFGRLQRETLLDYLHRCLHSEQQIEQKAGGAGLGLYFLSRSASTLLFNLLPGAATECICVFDLEAPRAELEQIGVFRERVDEIGRLAPQPLRVGRPPVERRRRRVQPPAMMTEMVAPLRAEKPWRKRPVENREMDQELRRQNREERELRRQEASLTPSEAALVMGESPRKVAVAGALLLVGILGLVVVLPRLYGAGDDDTARTVVALTREPPPARAAAGALSVSANISGRVTVLGSTSCRNRQLPLERCPLPDGRHTVVIESDELQLRHSFTVDVHGRTIERSVRLGYVEARPGYRLRLDPGQPPVARVALPEGPQTVTLVSQAPGSRLDLQVPVRRDETVMVP